MLPLMMFLLHPKPWLGPEAGACRITCGPGDRR